MALHVTLTGLRGLIAPTGAVLVYHALKQWLPGFETLSMLLPVALITLGAVQFTTMRRAFLADDAAARG